MSHRQRRLGVGFFGAMGAGALVVAAVATRMFHGGPPSATTAETSEPSPKVATQVAGPAIGPDTPLAELTARVARGDGHALTALHNRAVPPTPVEGQPAPPTEGALTDEQADEWIAALSALQRGLASYSANGKVNAAQTVRGILAKFSPEGTLSGWTDALEPAFGVLNAGLRDTDPDVRALTLVEVGGLWSWVPGCSMTEGDEKALAAWKQSLYNVVAAGLEDKDANARAGAVACLGNLPLNNAAAPAAALIADPDFRVRLQVLISFGPRPLVLSEDAILPLLHDPIPDLNGLAERVLTARGLDQDQIGLGRIVTHPDAHMRASAIPLLRGRDDIDPIVWLLYLTNDKDPGVRLDAVSAFHGRLTPEVLQRLREMAASDDSEAVRAAAEKLAPATSSTASLPPLPGSPSLTPRAN